MCSCCKLNCGYGFYVYKENRENSEAASVHTTSEVSQFRSKLEKGWSELFMRTALMHSSTLLCTCNADLDGICREEVKAAGYL